VRTCLALAGLSSAAADATGAPFTGFGRYHGGTVDTVENVLILPDHSFCLTIMGGSLDLVTAGRWTAQGDAIVLEEIKRTSPLIAADWEPSDRPQDVGKVVFEFDGLTLGGLGTLFGTSAGDEMPADMQPVFLSEARDLESPHIVSAPTGATTFTIAYPLPLLPDRNVYQALRYRLPQVMPGMGVRLRLSVNEQGARPPFRLTGIVSDGALTLEGEMMGKPAAIRAEDRTGCAAVLKKAETSQSHVGPSEKASSRLVPIVQSVANLGRATSAKPLFGPTSEESSITR
jgi:hypothetical protein